MDTGDSVDAPAFYIAPAPKVPTHSQLNSSRTNFVPSQVLTSSDACYRFEGKNKTQLQDFSIFEQKLIPPNILCTKSFVHLLLLYLLFGNRMSSLALFPDLCLLHIFDQLYLDDLLAIHRVCTRWKTLQKAALARRKKLSIYLSAHLHQPRYVFWYPK